MSREHWHSQLSSAPLHTHKPTHPLTLFHAPTHAPKSTPVGSTGGPCPAEGRPLRAQQWGRQQIGPGCTRERTGPAPSPPLWHESCARLQKVRRREVRRGPPRAEGALCLPPQQQHFEQLHPRQQRQRHALPPPLGSAREQPHPNGGLGARAAASEWAGSPLMSWCSTAREGVAFTSSSHGSRLSSTRKSSPNSSYAAARVPQPLARSAGAAAANAAAVLHPCGAWWSVPRGAGMSNGGPTLPHHTPHATTPVHGDGDCGREGWGRRGAGRGRAAGGCFAHSPRAPPAPPCLPAPGQAHLSLRCPIMVSYAWPPMCCRSMSRLHTSPSTFCAQGTMSWQASRTRHGRM